MKILGLSGFYHDSAAVLLDDGEIVAACQEERFTRKKFDAGFPHHAILACLQQAGIGLGDIDHVTYHEKPRKKFGRLIANYASFAPKGSASFGQAMPRWLGDQLWMRRKLRRGFAGLPGGADMAATISVADHHFSHAASAYFASPFTDAVVLTIDGVGEWETSSVSVGKGHRLVPQKTIRYPHSLGLLYCAITQYIGFKVLSGEYKVMGLAPYGQPVHADKIRAHLIDIRDDGSFALDMRYFDYCIGHRMFSDRMCELFGQPPRRADVEPVEQFHMDMAASIQVVIEEVVLKMTRALADQGLSENLCLAGGVALNCVANGKIERDGRFSNVWVQPAAGDAGCALGAALALWHSHQPNDAAPPAKSGDQMSGAYLGPAYADAEIERQLTQKGAVFTRLDDDALMQTVAQAMADQSAVGWFQGRMEFGPRALGNRSIIADPRGVEMQKTLNLKVKFRESFRPFAPAVLEEEAANWFELDGTSPYMLTTTLVRPEHRIGDGPKHGGGFGQLATPRSVLNSITHVDFSARVQTVSASTNPRFHALISAFRDLTGCPVVINTSFNVRGEPIVCSPSDAFDCFMGTDLEMLVVGNFVALKSEQTAPKPSAEDRHFERD